MNSVRFRKLGEPGYAVNEAINSLCTNISFSGEDVKVIALTSCHAHDGKSYVSMQSMRALAKLGKRVVFVDADLRRSNIVNRYGCLFEDKSYKGLTHYLAGMAEMSDIIYESDIPNAYLIPVGRTVANSLPLLSSNRFPALIKYLRTIADYVIVDTPPIGAIIDAAKISKYCDGTVLVVSYNQVPRQELVDCVRQMNQAGTPILGTVINGMDLGSYVNRKYYNKSYYSRYESSYSKSKTGTTSASSKSSKA